MPFLCDGEEEAARAAAALLDVGFSCELRLLRGRKEAVRVITPFGAGCAVAAV